MFTTAPTTSGTLGNRVPLKINARLELHSRFNSDLMEWFQDIFWKEAALRSFEFMLDGLGDFLVDLWDLFLIHLSQPVTRALNYSTMWFTQESSFHSLTLQVSKCCPDGFWWRESGTTHCCQISKQQAVKTGIKGNPLLHITEEIKYKPIPFIDSSHFRGSTLCCADAAFSPLGHGILAPSTGD